MHPCREDPTPKFWSREDFFMTGAAPAGSPLKTISRHSKPELTQVSQTPLKMLSKKILAIGVFLASMASATPVPVPAEDGLIIIEQTEIEDGTITWYGEGSTPITARSPVSPELHKRCGSNTVTCSGSHKAYQPVCINLINSLSSQSIPQSPRSVCLSQGGNQCCISWANVVQDAQFWYLQSAAWKALNGCVSNNHVSGLTRDTLIGNTCTTQCLSDRASGCS
ncbi:hypothetical protein B0H65DRAFT_508453 [Neurospora tetraspora]|uniref:WD-like domain-containing protein n=1 Tax=Neurospora tetraspora TaxID=94610 RepID=A0AAE0JEM1_9PEZI|nr:hypothetical protein B0H65DRAFT_508453 [Neurospora tetraspora]